MARNARPTSMAVAERPLKIPVELDGEFERVA